MGYNFSTIDGLFRPNYNVYRTSSIVSESEPEILEPVFVTYNPDNTGRVKAVLAEAAKSNAENQQNSTTEENTHTAEEYTEQNTPLMETPTKSTSVQRWISTYKGDRDRWLKEMYDAYRKAGLPDNAIRNLMAKNSLESNWGNSAQGAYNFGNITVGSSWKGNYVDGNDHDASGKPIKAKFRSYNNLDEYIKDEISLLTRLYEFNPNDDFETFVYKLQGGNKYGYKYAVNPQYASVLIQRYNKYFNGKSNS